MTSHRKHDAQAQGHLWPRSRQDKLGRTLRKRVQGRTKREGQLATPFAGACIPLPGGRRSNNPSSAQRHRLLTKDFGPWPTSSASTGGSLCTGFSNERTLRALETLLNSFFLVLQVIAVVWRDTPRAQGLPGRHNEGWLAAMFSVNNCGDQG